MASIKRPFAIIAFLVSAFLPVETAAKRYGITAAPDLGLAAYQPPGLFRRKQDCSFGRCGSTCLAQGAFCCNPGGTDKLEPGWICDNGACITSIRASSGIVDCYDPDNPSGTTQSCIDNVPTTTCRSTDRCYTCETDVPFCHWQTYIDTASPVLSWFSCISSSATDATFYAATITGTPSGHGVHLATGAIIGIAIGGAVFVLFLILLGWFILWHRRRKWEAPAVEPQTEPETEPDRTELPSEPRPVEMADSNTLRDRQYYPKSKSSQDYPSPPSYQSGYHSTLSPSDTVVAELPAPAQMQDTQERYHGPEERPYSWTRNDDRAISSRGSQRGY